MKLMSISTNKTREELAVNREMKTMRIVIRVACLMGSLIIYKSVIYMVSLRGTT